MDHLITRSSDGGITWTDLEAADANAATTAAWDVYCQLTTDRRGNWLLSFETGDSLSGTIGTDTDILRLFGSGPDTDEDGLADAAEVNVYGTDPSNPDSDSDSVCDGSGIGGGACTAGPDNCPFIENASQNNSDTHVAGDECQCGDVSGDLVLNALDVQIARERLMNAPLSGPFDVTRCNFIGGIDTVCEVDDIFVLDRVVGGVVIALENSCPAYFSDGAP